MERTDIITALKAHEEELRAAGVLTLSLFGSVARGEGSANDIDVAVRLGESFSARGLAYFGQLSELEKRLSGILGCAVDVIEEPVRHEYDAIREDRLWDIVQINLPSLLDACEEALRRMRDR